MDHAEHALMRKMNGFSTTIVVGLLVAGMFSMSGQCVSAVELKIVVTAAFVSEKGMPVYEEIAAYLAKKTGWEVKFLAGLSYADADAMLADGIIQTGFICGMPYVNKAAEGVVALVAIPVMNLKAGTFPGAPGYEQIPGKYYSYTIVKRGSSLRSWADLKGKTYAYNDPGSNSGYNLPRAKLMALGQDWGYFAKVVQSGSHEESIRLVAEGMVDASSVDSLVLDYDRSLGDEAALGVDIIDVLGPAGAPPVVMSTKVDPTMQETLTTVLTGMDEDPEGQAILAKALLLRFDPPNDQNYDDIRQFMAEAARIQFHDLE